MKKEIYSNEQVMDIFYSMKKSRQIEVLFNALGLMSSCNSQSETAVIALSMGLKGKDDNFYNEAP